ncbi:MAG TPA: transcriptional regulator PpsR [Rubrivivax sp.]
MRPFDAPKSSLGDLDAESVARAAAAASDLTLVLDAEGVILDIASTVEDLSAAELGSWIDQRWAERATGESRAKIEALLSRPDSHAKPARPRHVNHVLSDGTELPLMCSAVRVKVRTGTERADRFIVFGHDLRPSAALQQRLVDAQQAIEADYARLREAQARYRQLMQAARDAVLVVDSASMRVVEANAAAEHWFGVAPQRMVGETFPFGFDAAGATRLREVLAGVRASGRPDEMSLHLADDARAAGRAVLVGVSLLRQEGGTAFLVNVSGALAMNDSSVNQGLLPRLAQDAPDGLVVTDGDGRILAANRVFVELVQAGHEGQVHGESLDRWLGRAGVDLSVLLSNLRQRERVRLFATTLRGELGGLLDVEISATRLPVADKPGFGFSIRDVSRRISTETSTTRTLPRSAVELRELVGRVPLKDIVGDTTDLIEKLCIEAALELTRDNRASAAEMLGLSRQSLYVKLRRYGIGDLAQEGAN